MTPTKEQIKYLESCLLMEAYIETIKPKVVSIYNDVLKYYFKEGEPKDKRTGEEITHYEDLYRYDGNTTGYYIEVGLKLQESGFKVKELGHCPLLTAQASLRELERYFVKSCFNAFGGSIGGLSFKTLLGGKLSHYKDFLELNKRYVFNFVDTDKLTKQFS